MSRPAAARPVRVSPEGLFALSGVIQYIGAAVAVRIFDDLAPATVTWGRVGFAAVILLAVFRRSPRPWTRADIQRAAVFGMVTAAMNLCFYLAIARVDLGKSVVIEFIGPIAVAAALTRTWRNAAALVLAVGGVSVLSGTEITHHPGALALLLAASALWAGYILLGRGMAMLDRGLHGLGVSLALGTLALAPVGLTDAGALFGSARLLLLVGVIGACSSAIPYGIDQLVLRRIPVRRFAVLLALYPVTAMVVGAVALDQHPRLLDLIGAALVIVGVVVQERDELLADEAATEPS